MPRLFSVLCASVLLIGSIVSAQQTPEPPKPLKATPEVLAMIAQSERILDGIEQPLEKATMLFQLLTLELRLTDKEPARRTLQIISKLIPELEKETAKQQLLEAIAVAQADLGDRDAGVKTLNQIAKTSTRAETQFNVAEKILNDDEESKTDKPFDVTGLLRSAIAGAVEAKDPGLEALASAVLGRELAKQGKTDEAKKCFHQARQKARELEEIEERNIVALIIRSEIQGGMVAEALALVESASSPEQKGMFYALGAVTLAKSGKADEAEKWLALIPSGDVKDNAVIGLARESAKTASAAKLAEWSKLMSMPERKDIFLQNVVQVLMEAGRKDIALELAKESSQAADFELTLKIRELETLIEAKKFDEAAQFIETIEDPRLKQVTLRHLILARMKDGNVAEALTLAKATLTDEEKTSADELNAELPKVATIADFDERMSAYFELLQAQFKLFDLEGAQKTLGLMLQNVSKADDPAKTAVNRLVLSRVQAELNDKAGAKENLRQLVQFLGGIKDIMTLKGLVPDEKADRAEPDDDAETPQLKLDIKAPVDEDAIKNQLFEIYTTVAAAQSQVDDKAESQKTFQKAVELAAGEPDAMNKFEKFILLAQLQAELAGE